MDFKGRTVLLSQKDFNQISMSLDYKNTKYCFYHYDVIFYKSVMYEAYYNPSTLLAMDFIAIKYAAKNYLAANKANYMY